MSLKEGLFRIDLKQAAIRASQMVRSTDEHNLGNLSPEELDEIEHGAALSQWYCESPYSIVARAQLGFEAEKDESLRSCCGKGPEVCACPENVAEAAGRYDVASKMLRSGVSYDDFCKMFGSPNSNPEDW